ncbi:peptidase C39 family protein [Nonomuraea diastatica]|uniref:Peptidase C39 family protein n=1 Tax=Nonomuraea diastatica TaxID=1848329 RepID=A0A4R4WQB3_9ACTN|nr:peptidase C39 family protein [Nonomuraea diastatica]
MWVVLTVDPSPVAFARFAVPDGWPGRGSGSRPDRGPRTWIGEEHPIGFAATQLVPSWTARTPPGTWIEIALRATTASGARSKWYVMGRWSEHGDPRTSVPGQGDGDGDVAVDTFVARRPVVAYQLRVTRHGESARVTGLGVMASALPRHPLPPSTVGGPGADGGTVDATGPDADAWPDPQAGPDADAGPDAGGGAGAVELAVPRHSQYAHAGHHLRWDGGGANWCSPASVAMVLGFWGRGPGPGELAWVGADDPAPMVDHAAMGVYDESYQGTGNWPFNVAYAGRFGLAGFVTRLRSAAELERFVRAGIPVITSQSFKAHELPGSGYSTNGHIMVVTGFTAAGDVVVNDPAAPAGAEVRRVYPRAAFERVWLRSPGSGGSGGIVYILHPPDRPLPPCTNGNW